MMKQRSEGWTDQACPVLTRSLALSSSTPFSLVSSPLAGSSSHNGRLVWVFLLGQIEVSLLPSESDSLPPLTVPDFKCMATPPFVSR